MSDDPSVESRTESAADAGDAGPDRPSVGVDGDGDEDRDRGVDVDDTAVATTADAGPASESESESEPPEPVDVEHAPPRLTQFVAAGGAILGAALTAPFVLLALPFGIAGATIVAASAFLVQSRGWLTVGTGLVLVGTVVTGVYGAVPPALMLASVGATILGWDVGQHGIVIGEQLGRSPRSRRIQVVHAATSAIVIGGISAVAYLVYLFAGDGRPAQAVALVVLGVIVLAWVFRS